jgi:hypothetical protein
MSQFPDVDLIAKAAAAVRRPGVTLPPAATLAVADWLDTGANPYSCVTREPMIAVATAVLADEGTTEVDRLRRALEQIATYADSKSHFPYMGEIADGARAALNGEDITTS